MRGPFRQSVAEIVLIVVGVLIALWVDAWRADVAERRSIQAHLAGIVAEIDSNRWSLHRIRDGSVPVQLDALEQVIHVLSQSEPQVDDPEQFVQTLLESSRRLMPWLNRDSFESFRTSTDFHSTHIQELSSELSGAYEAPSALYGQRYDRSDPYADLVAQLIPARYQSESNEMRAYLPNEYLAPRIVDEEPVTRTIADLIENRTEIVRLARLKAQRITARWYAMTRMILHFQIAQDAIRAHPLMRDVVIPESDLADDLRSWRL